MARPISASARPVPGPGQILIKVEAAGVNRPDIAQRLGAYPPPPGESDIPGLEVSGRVVEIGEGVTDIKIGDEVCALVGSGGYATFFVVVGALLPTLGIAATYLLASLAAIGMGGTIFLATRKAARAPE